VKKIVATPKQEERREMSWGQRDGDINQGTETVIENPDAKYRNKPARALKRWAVENSIQLHFENEETGPKGAKTFGVRLKLAIEGIEIVCEGSGDKRKEAQVLFCWLI
jgi:hypothetical protein